MKAQDETRIREQLDLIARWRASGLPKAQWTAQHGVELKHLMGWLTYERRWKARLSGHNAHNAPFILKIAVTHGPQGVLNGMVRRFAG